jgi:PAS domain S-box-containing protein
MTGLKTQASPALAATTPQHTNTLRTQYSDLLHLFLDHVTEYVIVLLGPRGCIIKWSRGAERSTGYTEAEMLGRHCSCLYPPDEQVNGKPALLLQHAQAERCIEEEGWWVRKDGSRFWANIVLTALYDPCERLQGFGTVAHDCTERRRTEAALRESEARYRELVENANDAIATFTVDGRITSFNRGAERMLGWSRQEVLGRSYRDFYTPASSALADERTRRFLAGEKLPSTFEVEERCKDGRIIVAETRTRPLYDDTGKLVGFQGIQRDITARKRAAEDLRQAYASLEQQVQERTRALQQTNAALQQEILQRQRVEQQLRGRLTEIETLEERLRLAFAAARMSYWDRDLLTGTMVRSEGAEAMVGLASGELGATSERFFSLIHPEDRERVQASIARTLREGEAYEEYRVIWPDGSSHWLATHARTFTDPTGQPIRMIGVNLDITARKHAEERLRQSEERFRVALEKSPITVFHQDTELRYTWIYNPTPGFRVEDIIGKRDDELLSPQEAAQLTTVKQQALASRQRLHQEVS